MVVPPSVMGSSAGSQPVLLVLSTIVVAAFCNLLPFGGSTGSQACAGMYTGKGHLPVLNKLGGQIWRWEFVDMSKLLPEFWDHSPKACRGAEWYVITVRVSCEESHQHLHLGPVLHVISRGPLRSHARGGVRADGLHVPHTHCQR